MSLRLLIDEDTQSKLLIARLKSAGHDVVTASEAGLEAAADERVLAWATAEGRAVLTQNCKHFADLHEGGAIHAGVIAIYRNRLASKDMTHSQVLQALAKLDASEMDLVGQFVALNAWR